eukprot:3457834-Prymnesium_polylepis.1
MEEGQRGGAPEHGAMGSGCSSAHGAMGSGCGSNRVRVRVRSASVGGRYCRGVASSRQPGRSSGTA